MSYFFWYKNEKKKKGKGDWALFEKYESDRWSIYINIGGLINIRYRGNIKYIY